MRQTRGHRGQAIAEAPATMIFLLLCLAFPLICFASFGYRALFLYFACRDSSYAAAKSPTYTQGVANGIAAYTRDAAHFIGMTATPQIYVGTKPLPTGKETYQQKPLASINTSTNIYFMCAVVSGTIEPLIPTGQFFGQTVPGLTGPFPISISTETYVENPQGLAN